MSCVAVAMALTTHVLAQDQARGVGVFTARRGDRRVGLGGAMGRLSDRKAAGRLMEGDGSG